MLKIHIIPLDNCQRQKEQTHQQVEYIVLFMIIGLILYSTCVTNFLVLSQWVQYIPYFANNFFLLEPLSLHDFQLTSNAFFINMHKFGLVYNFCSCSICHIIYCCTKLWYCINYATMKWYTPILLSHNIFHESFLHS